MDGNSNTNKADESMMSRLNKSNIRYTYNYDPVEDKYYVSEETYELQKFYKLEYHHTLVLKLTMFTRVNLHRGTQETGRK